MRWHFLVTAPGLAADNMALDEALMQRSARSGEAVFRIYGWSQPTLSLGRNQRARGCYRLDEAARRGVAFVRRPTGGRALLHHREITYSAALPCASPSEAREAYDFINDVLLDGLAAMGVPAGRAANPAAIPPGIRPCFDVPSEHEIAVDGRKLVGSAQWRRDGGLLQHGSILVRDDQALIPLLMNASDGTDDDSGAGAATLFDALGREPDQDEVAGHLRTALASATGAAPSQFVADGFLVAEQRRLSATYLDDTWTWRR